MMHTPCIHAVMLGRYAGRCRVNAFMRSCASPVRRDACEALAPVLHRAAFEAPLEQYPPRRDQRQFQYVMQHAQVDGPLLLQKDRSPGLRYDGSIINPPPAGLWG